MKLKSQILTLFLLLLLCSSAFANSVVNAVARTTPLTSGGRHTVLFDFTNNTNPLAFTMQTADFKSIFNVSSNRYYIGFDFENDSDLSEWFAQRTGYDKSAKMRGAEWLVLRMPFIGKIRIVDIWTGETQTFSDISRKDNILISYCPQSNTSKYQLSYNKNEILKYLKEKKRI